MHLLALAGKKEKYPEGASEAYVFFTYNLRATAALYLQQQ